MIEHSQERVFNQASPLHVIGFSILPALIGGLLLFAGIAHFDAYRQAPHALFAWLLGSALFLGWLGYVLGVGGKSVKVTEEGLIIELWLSEWLHLKRRHQVFWKSIRGVQYKEISGPRGATKKLNLDTDNGWFTFWSVCFSNVELQRLRKLIQERTGK